MKKSHRHELMIRYILFVFSFVFTKFLSSDSNEEIITGNERKEGKKRKERKRKNREKERKEKKENKRTESGY